MAGHILTAIPAYAYLRFDWSTVLSLFVHHAWIGGFFIVGAGAHSAIYLVKEYQLHYRPVLCFVHLLSIYFIGP